MARGMDDSPVIPLSEPKSFSSEHTLSDDTCDIEEIRKHLLVQSERVGQDLRLHGYSGRTVTLKIKFANFRTITRSRTFQDHTSSTPEIYRRATELLDQVDVRQKVRLVGVGVSNLSRGIRQLSMLDRRRQKKEMALDNAVDRLRQRHGTSIVMRGSIVEMIRKNDEKGQEK